MKYPPGAREGCVDARADNEFIIMEQGRREKKQEKMMEDDDDGRDDQ